MFNKTSFNKTLFNRLIPLFRNYTEIELFGEAKGFEGLLGILNYYANLIGVEQITINKLGQLYFTVEITGEEIIVYEMDGFVYVLIMDGNVEYIKNLIGEVNKNGGN
jgi:hypothetical protein